MTATGALTPYTGTLNPDHIALIEGLRGQWMTDALTTTPADRDTTAAHVTALYAAHDLPAPAIVWLDSPYAGAIGSWMTNQLGDQLWGQLRGQLGGQLRGQLGGQLGDQLGGQLGGQLGDQLGGQLGGQLWGQLRGQLGGQLRDQLGDQLRGQLRDQLRGQLRDQLGWRIDPMWDAYWLAFYAACLQVAAIAPTPKLDRLADVTRNTGWWWPQRGIAVLTDRPTVAHVDQQNRWHCETGPAIAYRDGWSLNFWRGTPVPDWVVGADGGPTPERIFAETNTEVRRCAIEAFGWERFIPAAGLSLVDEQADPGNPGHTIGLYDVPSRIYGDPVRVLLCTNGTPERTGERHRFGLTVPDDMPDALTAAAWGYGLDAKTYSTCARRT